ncbi:MAG TPA: histidinol dehydrogenase, partial [Enterobacteriaceae bacterium]|nr:histidinol dehydrogenase [Enterobacteriaceae bacterium]
MSINWLKKASKTAESNTSEARRVVDEMLATIKEQGEEAVRRYASKLDNWSGDIILTPEHIATQIREVPGDVRRDIDYAIEQVYSFACAQRESV